MYARLTRLSVLLMCAVVLGSWPDTYIGAQTEKFELYRDPNGYFLAIPPEGWLRKEFPEETVRSKVEFYHPEYQNGRISIRVIAGQIITPGLTLQEWYEQSRRNLEEQKLRYPSGRFHVSISDEYDYEALLFEMAVPPFMASTVVNFLVEPLQYSVALGAPNESTRADYLPVFRAFLGSLTPLSFDGEFTSDEVRRAAVSRLVRIAQTFEQLGEVEPAITAAEEGLQLEPDNAELVKILSRLREAQGQTR